MKFAFEGLELDLAVFELRRDGVPVPMEPQVFDVLAYLVQHRDRVVAKEELMDQLWGGRFVSEAAVTSRIKQARRALGDDGQSQRMIKTLHGRGYRFVARFEAQSVQTSTSTCVPWLSTSSTAERRFERSTSARNCSAEASPRMVKVTLIRW